MWMPLFRHICTILPFRSSIFKRRGSNALGDDVGFVDEFVAFLNKHKVIGLAVAFIIGAAAAKLVSALVADIVMRVIAVLVPGGEWRAAVLQLGPVKLLIGDFVGALIDFVIIAFVVFMIVKYAVKEEGK
ncbi:Large-conductance mechanosensitive channel [uncultured archaeon]|nr:Large-conductance mechanosensitive channel [uncultured archaeon]